MFSRILTLAAAVTLVTTACATSQPLNPLVAQQILTDAWRLDQHAVWELDWPAAPIGGPLTVESWRSGSQYRFEILEAVPPALVGRSLVFDGQQAWQYNRFDPPSVFEPAPALLSPVSDAFTIIDQQVTISPETAAQMSSRVNFSPAQKITVAFANRDTLTFWLDAETGLPVKITFSIAGQQAALTARYVEPLPAPPDGLFSVGDWLY